MVGYQPIVILSLSKDPYKRPLNRWLIKVLRLRCCSAQDDNASGYRLPFRWAHGMRPYTFYPCI